MTYRLSRSKTVLPLCFPILSNFNQKLIAIWLVLSFITATRSLVFESKAIKNTVLSYLVCKLFDNSLTKIASLIIRVVGLILMPVDMFRALHSWNGSRALRLYALTSLFDTIPKAQSVPCGIYCAGKFEVRSRYDFQLKRQSYAG